MYRPYRPKRRTRASIAKERGLEPLANVLMMQPPRMASPTEMAAKYVDEEKGVPTPDDALQGAMDIIAEAVSDDAGVRARLKAYYHRECAVYTRAAADEPDENSTYRMYYDHREPLRMMPGHRVLAMNRAEKEGAIKVALDVNVQTAQAVVRSGYVRNNGSSASEYVAWACDDAYSRLIAPSLDTELRGELTDKAQSAAIRVFALNLKPLLMAPPVKGRTAIGLDPGYAHGCKIAVVDETGMVLDTAVIYPVGRGAGAVQTAKDTVKRLINKHVSPLQRLAMVPPDVKLNSSLCRS